jgi:predicted metalloenzyme YecM
MPKSIEVFYTVDAFFAAARPIITAFNAWVKTYEPKAIADHLCYKCGSAQEFERIRKLFEGESAYIRQSIISGRRIAVIRFKGPDPSQVAIPTKLGDIHYLELSDQKPDGSQKSGFDHIEIVPTRGTMKTLAERLMERGVPFTKSVRPHHTTYDTVITGGYEVRLESEMLARKVAKEMSDLAEYDELFDEVMFDEV